VLGCPPGVDEKDLVDALQTLIDHHDTLRLRVTGGTGGRRGLEVLPRGAVSARERLTRVDIAELDETGVVAAVAQAGEAARRRLRPGDAEVLRAVWFDAGPGRPGRLLLVVHHLAVDSVSWRTLTADLVAAWQAVLADRDSSRTDVTGSAENASPLPPVLTSYRRWAELLVAEAHSGERVAELPLWQEALSTPDPQLGRRPVDPSRDTAATLRTLNVTLPARWTQPLLTTAPAAFHAGVNDVLLTALALAFASRRAEQGQGADPALLLDLEGHGREEISDRVDLTRTVGWFTSMYPVRLDPGPVGRTESQAYDGPLVDRALKRIKEQLRSLPDHGIGYGLLRHLNPATRELLRGAAAPQVGFNYLGRYPGSTWPQEPDTGCTLPLAGGGPRRPDPDMPVHHVIDINAYTQDLPQGPQLLACWTWPAELLDEQDVQRLADGWLRALRAIADHAQAPDAGGYTPSDLPLVSLNQTQLDRLQSKWGGRK